MSIDSFSQGPLFPTASDTRAQEYYERFRNFHEQNPHVLRELLKLTRTARGAGMRRGGMKQLFEVLRWNTEIGTTKAITEEGNPVKLSNSMTAFYARALIEVDPSLHEFFQCKPSFADYFTYEYFRGESDE